MGKLTQEAASCMLSGEVHSFSDLKYVYQSKDAVAQSFVWQYANRLTLLGNIHMIYFEISIIDCN